eukprot:g61366.t1
MAGVVSALKKGGVTPDLLPALPETLDFVKVQFKTWTLDGKNIGLQTKAAACDVLTPPKVSWLAKQDKLYTVVILDPDAPSRKKPTNGPWLHYLIVNVPGADIYWLHYLIVNIPGADTGSGKCLAEYVGVGAPKGTGHHRYVYLVYQQKEKMEAQEKPMKAAGGGGAGRSKFSWLDGFVAKNLKGASLVAANFLEAEYDESVPKLYEGLKGIKSVILRGRFCVDSKQCLQPGDVACLQGQVRCLAARGGGMYGAHCDTPCRWARSAPRPLVGNAGAGNCSALPSALGGAMIGDTSSTASCWDEALTQAVLAGAAQKFAQTFRSGYEGATKLRALNATLASLVLQQATLRDQEQRLAGDLNASVRRAADAMREYQDSQGELAGQFDVQTRGVLQRLDDYNDNLAADVTVVTHDE